jgi:hypothetical protein
MAEAAVDSRRMAEAGVDSRRMAEAGVDSRRMAVVVESPFFFPFLSRLFRTW